MASRRIVFGHDHLCRCSHLLYKKDEDGVHTFAEDVLNNLRGRDDVAGMVIEIDCPKCGVAHAINLKEK